MARTTITDLQKLTDSNTPITMITCYDYTFAKLVEQADIDVILIGDSLGNVMQGHDTTIPVTVDDIIYHTKAVVRGTQKPHIIADMPFMSYQTSEYDALHNAGRLLKEGGAQSVKLEGGATIAPIVKKMTAAGIPVCGHLGLTPQSVHAMGGYSVQARAEAAAQQLISDALALQDAGAYMIVLEVIPATLAKIVSEKLHIPTIGIGAGPHCDGQVLVLQDMLGLNPDFKAKFVKLFNNLGEQTIEALNSYSKEVKAREFPAKEHSFK